MKNTYYERFETKYFRSGDACTPDVCSMRISDSLHVSSETELQQISPPRCRHLAKMTASHVSTNRSQKTISSEQAQIFSLSLLKVPNARACCLLLDFVGTL